MQNGYINAIVYVALSASLTTFGYLSDLIGRKGWLSKTVSRKLFEIIGLVMPAICMALIPVAGCDQNLVVLLIVLSMVLWGAVAGGDTPIVVDVAPSFSGSLYGVTNAISSTAGFLAPLFVGVLLDQAGPDVSLDTHIRPARVAVCTTFSNPHVSNSRTASAAGTTYSIPQVRST